MTNVCNLEVRKFDYSKYPSFVTQLFQYHFKAIIMAVGSETINLNNNGKFRKHSASSIVIGLWMRLFDSTTIHPCMISTQKYGDLSSAVRMNTPYLHSSNSLTGQCDERYVIGDKLFVLTALILSCSVRIWIFRSRRAKWKRWSSAFPLVTQF